MSESGSVSAERQGRWPPVAHCGSFSVTSAAPPRGMRSASVSIPEHDVVGTPDGRFAYLSDGDATAPLALCLHGLPDHPLSSRPLMAQLAGAGYRGDGNRTFRFWPPGSAPLYTHGGPTSGRQRSASMATISTDHVTIPIALPRRSHAA